MNGIQMMVQELMALEHDQKLHSVIKVEEATCSCCGRVAHGPHEIEHEFYTRKTDSYKPNGKLGRRAGTALQPCKQCTGDLKKGKLCKKKH